MIKEHQICVKQILDKFVSFIYRCIGYALIFIIVLFFVYPYYQEYDYMQKCQQDRTKDWCEQTWLELQRLD